MKKEDPIDRDLAWRLLEQNGEWIARADTRASVASVIQTVVLGYLLTNFDAPITSWAPHMWVLALAAAFAGLSLVVSLWVVLPRLDRKVPKAGSQRNHLYFGAVRTWTATELVHSLEEDEMTATNLAEVIIATAKIAWAKHAALQVSILALSTSLVLVAAAFVVRAALALGAAL